ncbi:hypothetical protein MKW94_005835 [Papaver nudicaule]|uniref:Uncharacterized protein n=1 Tax=Papaver nudicaule TaxID=74823 RepID=A0AA41VQP7_PAPNU|nr:hypothetical protein [Papaver nudicaule]
MKQYQEVKEKMVVDGNGSNKWREKEMEGENNLRTLECLRGRLLAERVASKSAKDDADFMENKLMELEKQLSIETELRNRAQKKLKLLLKKMKSMNSVKSSSTTFSDHREPEKQNSDSQISKPVKFSTPSQEGISDGSITRVSKENSVCSLSDHDHQMTTTVSSSGSAGTAHSRKNSEDRSIKEEPRKIKDNEPREIQEEKQSETQEEEPSKNQDKKPRESMAEHMRQTSTDGKEVTSENNPDELIENSLALVPTTIWPTSTTNEPKINSGKVLDVLTALRHAKKQLQNSMGRKDVSICSR